MPNPRLLAPIAGDDPCGPDLRWDPAFMGLMDAMSAAGREDEGSILEAEVVQSGARSFEDIVELAVDLSARTKDMRVLAVYAEAAWRDGGLAVFGDALEDVAAVLETWPGPADGVHPRADEVDGDLGERAAALGRLLKRIPDLATTVGWGAETTRQRKVESSVALKGVFGSWQGRLDAAFGSNLPSSTEAWRSLRALVVDSAPSDGAAGEENAAVPGEGTAAPVLDVWDLIDRAVEQMGRQDRHSPALPVLQLLAAWRSLDIVEIADSMKQSGVPLEQLLESVKKQTRGAA